MKKITLLLFTLFAFTFSNQINAQCPVEGTEGPYDNFNSNFGGAPCDDGSGSPFNEIDTFEAWADESYVLDNVVTGYTYTFSLCNGAGAGSWVPSFTIVAPSGAVDAFGLDAGSSCALTWTASEEGTYTIVISEEGAACGASTNQAVDNGFPAITGTDGENCIACTEFFPPACTTVIAPADNAVDVETVENITDFISSREVTLSWDAIDGADSYDISFNGVVLGTTGGTEINLYGLELGTTYTWSIAPINCAGTASGCATWTFTTESELSVGDVEKDAFTYTYDSNLNLLNLNSSNEVFSNITIFSISGQEVMSKSLNNTSESISVSELSTGIYLAKVSINGNSKTVKFIKN